MKFRQSLVPFLIMCLSVSCKGDKQDNPLFELMENSGISFVNELKETKDYNVFKYRNFYNGGGVATGDLNNDGLADVFFTANQGPNKLYLNKGNLQFEDISAKAGFIEKKQWSTGVVFVDINTDGWLDIYVCNAGNMLDKSLRKNQLFINNQNLTFTESAAKYGLDNDGYSTQASFFDYDLDGDLDCFLVNNSPIPVNTLNYANMRNVPDAQAPYAEFLKGGGDHFFRNDNGRFKDISKEAGIYGSIISFGLGVTVGDVNQDGYPDVYVSNDFFEKDYLYINQRNGTFKDELEERIQHISFSSMGADMQDINNDGKPDIFTTDMLPGDDYRLKTNTSFEGYEVFRLKQNQGFYNQFTQNALQVNRGDGNFLETAFFSGVAASDWSWGALMFDADNDKKTDILVCNGIYRDVTDQDFIDFFANQVVSRMALTGKKEDVETVISEMPSIPIPNSIFKNEGRLKFSEKGKEWGLSKPSFSNGAAYADLDNDGDLDLVVNNVNQPAMVYKNRSREKDSANYLTVQLKYLQSNSFAIGSTVKVYSNGEMVSRELIPSRGFQSSVDYKLVFGLGQDKADSVHVVWPDGQTTVVLNPGLNHLIAIDYANEKLKKKIQLRAEPDPLFTLDSLFAFRHQEDDHVDFYTERNIPFMLSKQGPKAAVADVNGDGLQDLFVGNAVNQERYLFVQTPNGFVKKEVEAFKRFVFNDVTSAFFFDADQDGDQDLFTGGGGNFAPANSNVYQNLLFLNDGKGNFSLKPGAIQSAQTNCGTAIPFDYDQDGRMDIFLGSRSEPQQYGEMPKSYIYHNDGNGSFSEVNEKVAPFLTQLGMVTAALWSDLTGNGKPVLAVTGEWMAPRMFAFTNGVFKELASGMEKETGWWQHMAAADLDADGDLDLILGNLGENFYLKPDASHPVKLWVKDFDRNGLTEKVISHVKGDKDVPVFLKKEITDQVPSLKKMNLKHKDFASKSIQDLFESGADDAKHYDVVQSSSCIAYNDGKGHFTLSPLPMAAQLSSINVSAVKDLNGDKLPDLLVAGNFFDLLPQFCRVDASYGNVFINKGKSGFEQLPVMQSGLKVKGQVRDLHFIQTPEHEYAIFFQNNEVPRVYLLNTKTK